MDDPTGTDSSPAGRTAGDTAGGTTGDTANSLVDLDAVAADLAAVTDALARLDDGTYGRCAACDAPIDDDVLAASPTRLTCDAHLPV